MTAPDAPLKNRRRLSEQVKPPLPAVIALLGNADFLIVHWALPEASPVPDRADFSTNDVCYVYNTRTGLRSDHR
jgi:hypothetical protein